MTKRGVSDSDAASEFSETSWDEHNSMMKIYTSLSSSSSSSSLLRSKIAPSDLAALHSRHQFIRDDKEDAKQYSSWEVRMARRYYNLLYKEFAIADLSRFTEGKIGLRWRMEKEVVEGKGQFVCGATSCNSYEELHSYELPFQYVEDGMRKSELVKVRVCKQCAVKLFYKKVKEKESEKKKRMLKLEVKAEKRQDRNKHNGDKRRRDSNSEDDERNRSSRERDGSGNDCERSTCARSGGDNPSSIHSEKESST